MKKGIITHALGHPYYGKYAAGLAASLYNFGIPITLICTESALTFLDESEKALFHSIKIAPEKQYVLNGKNSYTYAKLFASINTPFEETLMLDADLIWLTKNPKEIFEQFKDISFTASNEGFYDVINSKDYTNPTYPYWAELSDIMQAYRPKDKLYKLRSEFVYFKSNAEVSKLFKSARAIYASPKTAVTTFAGGVADEYALNIASAQDEIYPHQPNYNPVYWQEKPMKIGEIMDKFFAFSMGGKRQSKRQKDIYNSINKSNAQKLGIRPFSAKDKSAFLIERKEK